MIPAPVSALASSATKILLLSALVLSAFLAGRLILDKIKFDAPAAERRLYSVGLGCGAWMLAIFLLGAAGLLYAPLIGIMLAASLIPLARRRPALLDFRPLLDFWAGLARGEKLSAAALAAVLVLMLPQTLAPEIFYDALVYHLAIPRQWLLAHRLIADRALCYSGIPANAELLYAAALALSDDSLAKLVHFAFGVGALAALCLIVRKFSSRRAAFLACLLVLSVPATSPLMYFAVSDLCFVFFALLSFLLIFSDGDDGNRRLVLAGIFCGIALGTRYSGWSLLPVFSLVVFIRRSGGRRGFAGAALFAATAGLCVFPWLVRNAVVFDNPIYPISAGPFGNSPTEKALWAALRHDVHARGLSMLASAAGIFQWLAEPLTEALHGWGGRQRGLGLGFLLLGPFLYFVPRKKSAALAALAVLAAWYAVSLASGVVRYRIFAIFLGAGLAAAAFDDALGRVRARLPLFAGAAAALTLYALFGWARLLPTDGWRVTLGVETRLDYLARPHKLYRAPYIGAAEFVARSSPPGARVVVLGDARTYYYDRPVVAASVFDQHPFLQLFKQGLADGAILDRLETWGAHHIVLNEAEWSTLRESGYWPMTEEESRRLWDFLSTYSERVFEETDPGRGKKLSVYKLRNPARDNSV